MLRLLPKENVLTLPALVRPCVSCIIKSACAAGFEAVVQFDNHGIDLIDPARAVFEEFFFCAFDIDLHEIAALAGEAGEQGGDGDGGHGSCGLG